MEPLPNFNNGKDIPLKWAGNTGGVCWRCGKKFIVDDGVIASANALPDGIRRAAVACSNGCNYGDVVLFPGDYEY